MKGKFLTLAAMAAMLVAGCAKDSDLDTAPVVDDWAAGKTVAYANIRVATAATGTRAEEEKFDKGTAEESAVSSISLYFYDKSGKLVGASSLEKWETGSKSTAYGDYATYSNKKVKISLVEGAGAPVELLAIVNDEKSDIEVGSTKDDALEAIYDNVKHPTFVMTNSVYYDDNQKLVQLTPVDAKFLFETEEEAGESEDYINVYVERVVAKVSVSLAADFEKQSSTIDVIYNDNVYALKFNATDWDVTATADKTFAVKHLREYEAYKKNFREWMSATAANRSYWAQSYYSLPEYDKKFPLCGTQTTGNVLNYKTAKTVAKTGFGKSVYVAENTARGDRFTKLVENPMVAATSVLVYGTYDVWSKKEDGSLDSNVTIKAGDNFESFDIGFFLHSCVNTDHPEVRYELIPALNDTFIGGLRLSDVTNLTDALLGKFASTSTPDPKDTGFGLYDFRLYCPESYKQDGETVYNPANKYFITLADEKDGYIYNESKGEYVKGSKDDVDALLRDVCGSFTLYNNSKAYFYVPLEHHAYELDESADDPTADVILTGTYGVVRNHYYSLNITSASGLALGYPYDEDALLLPNPAGVEDLWINSELNVLPWHSMIFNVDLK